MDPHRPRPARSLLAASAVAVLLVLGLGGCGTDGEVRVDGGGDAPGPDGPAPVRGLPPDQVVWVDAGGGGMVPPSPVAPHLASLTIYGDGRAFRAVAPSDRDHLAAVPVEVGTVAPDDLAALVAAAEASGLFTAADTDLGDPQVTDLGSEVVRFHGTGAAVEISAYAFDERFEDDLTDAQQDRRAALRDLLERAEAAATGFEPWTPDRVAVAELDQRSSYGGADGDPTAWPGPAFDTFLAPTERYGAAGCGELTGDDATAVWAAALDGSGTTWIDGDDQRELVVAALLPGQEPCVEG